MHLSGFYFIIYTPYHGPLVWNPNLGPSCTHTIHKIRDHGTDPTRIKGALARAHSQALRYKECLLLAMSYYDFKKTPLLTIDPCLGGLSVRDFESNDHYKDLLSLTIDTLSFTVEPGGEFPEIMGPKQ